MMIPAPDVNMRRFAMQYVLSSGEVDVIYFSLVARYTNLRKQLHTKYDGDPRFGQEDQAFLTDEIQNVKDLLHRMFNVTLS